jgi:hypothetical protein
VERSRKKWKSDDESGGQEFESLRARHLAGNWERQKPDISVLDAATRVRSSSFLEPIQTSNHGGST